MFFSLFWAVYAREFFNLDLWSRRVWVWLSGGLAVLVVDALIASVAAFSAFATLSLLLALVG